MGLLLPDAGHPELLGLFRRTARGMPRQNIGKRAPGALAWRPIGPLKLEGAGASVGGNPENSATLQNKAPPEGKTTGLKFTWPGGGYGGRVLPSHALQSGDEAIGSGVALINHKERSRSGRN